jgi:CheY-like chemotaxis protein
MLETRGYRVLAFTNTADALDRFRDGGVDLAFVEVSSPTLDGPRLIDRLKDASPHTPVVLLSAKSRTLERENRADLFLARNMCNSVDLMERIRVLMVRKRGPKRSLRVLSHSQSAGAA